MPQIVHLAVSAAQRSQVVHGWRWWNKRSPRLDLKTLPEHLKRDLGFSSGRASPLRDPLRD